MFVFSQTNISGIINNYAAVTNINFCPTTITLDNASLFNVGDSILIIQMQGATINSTNTAAFGNITALGSAGNFEKNFIATIAGNVISLGLQLINSYDVSGSVQIVSIPHYVGDVNVTGVLTAADWNGVNGGVLIFSASGTVSLIQNVDVSGKGFRGGANVLAPPYNCTFLSVVNGYDYPLNTEFSAGKGEGIAAFNLGQEAGRGKQANGGGGGNDHNSGGGGGGNGSSGGIGGINDEPGTFRCRGDFPGIGGLAVPYTTNRLFMGGGGGAGHGNGSAYAAPDGAGIVIIKANTILGLVGSIQANGLSGVLVGGDGGVGGSSGGTVMLEVQAWSASLIVNISGGFGGNTRNNLGGVTNPRCHGPGGGGGAGALIYNQATYTNTLLATPGPPGIVTLTIGSATCLGSNLGATAGGGPGLEIANRQIPLSPTPASLDTSFATSLALDTIELCVGQDYPFSIGASPGHAIQWQIDSSGLWQNLIPNANHNNVNQSNGFIIQNVQTYMDFYSYRMRVIGPCDTAFTNRIYIHVIGLPIIVTQPTSVNTCAGLNAFFVADVLDATSYQWQMIAPTPSNLTNNAIYNGVQTDSLYLTNIPPSLNGAVFRLQATGPCGSRLSSPVFLNFANSVITISAQTPGPNLTLCQGGDSPIYFTSSSIVDNIQWRVNMGAGFVILNNGPNYQGVNNDTLLLLNPGLSQSGYIYQATLTNTCGGLATTDSITLNVDAAPSISVAGPINACEGNGVFITPTPPTGSGITYQWQVNSAGSWVDLTNTGGYSNTTSFALGIASGSVTVVLNGNFYRILINTNCGADTSNSVILNVTPSVVYTLQPVNDTVCLGATAVFIASANNALSYQWQSNAGGIYANLSNNAIFSGVNTNTLSISNAGPAQTGILYRLRTQGNSPCGFLNSNAVQLYLVASVNSITSTSASFTYCPGLDTTINITFTGTVDSIIWQRNSGGGMINLVAGPIHSNVNTAILVLTGMNASLNGNTYRAIIYNNCGESDTSSIIQVTMYEVTNYSYGLSQIVCDGGQVSFTQTTNYPVAGKQWQRWDGNAFVNIPNAAPYSSVNSDTLIINPVNFTMNNDSFRVVVVDSCGLISQNPNPMVLNVLPIQTGNINLNLCTGDSLVLSDGSVVNTTGVYNDTVTNPNGCDSVVVFNLTVNLATSALDTQTICNGEQYVLPGGGIAAVSGIYTDTLSGANAFACDSIIETNLIVLPNPNTLIVDSFCPGGSYTLISGVVVNNAGTYNDTLFSGASNGCDSLLIYNLSFTSYPSAVQVTDSICFNENYVLPDGTLVNTTGVYNDTIPASNSCDSIVVTNLYVRPANIIVAQSQSVTVCPGANALFYATSAQSEVTYQWFLGGIALIGEINDTLIIPNVVSGNSGGSYQLAVYSSCDTIFSNSVLLTLRQIGSVATDPLDEVVCEGETGTFSITTNVSIQSYQWYVNGGVVLGSNGASYTTPALSLADDGSQYFCAITDSCGNLDSSAVANLTVNPNLSISSSSSSISTCATDDVLFYIQATGTNVTYQWLENGFAMSGETNDTLLLAAVISAQDGNTYACQVNSACGNLFSSNMVLTVNEISQITNQTNDIRQCGGFSFEVSVDANDVNTYQWQINQGVGFVNLNDGTLGVGPIEISGSSTPVLTVSNYDLSITGTQFQVILTTSCGAAPIFTPVSVTITERELITDRVADTVFCLRDISAVFVHYVDGAAEWSNGNIGQFFLPDLTGDYIVNFTDSNFCPQADTVFVELEDCVANCVVVAPTGFSPNGSGLNDIFKAIYTCELDFYELIIYNRWGGFIFLTNDPLLGWDGTYKGQTAEIGTYSWYLVYKKAGADRKADLKGNVTLIR